MKKRWQIIFYLLLYLLVLSFALAFDIRRLFDLRDIAVLVIGTLLLAIPFWERSKEKGWLCGMLSACKKRVIDAGVLQTFVLLFIRLSEERGYEGLLADAALCFRPMLYAFCIRLILEPENKIKPETENAVRDITYEDCIQAGLTRREAEIAVLVCLGCTNSEIAEELVISQATVKKHMSNIFEKTGIKKREELKTYIEQCKK